MFDMTDDELQDFIMDQFMRYDADQDGYLDRREFRELLMDAELGLSKKDARAIMAEADENDDGALEYRGVRSHHGGDHPRHQGQD